MKMTVTLSIGALVLGIAHVSLAQQGLLEQAPPTHDQLRIAAQKICPVSGEVLGEHGTPIKVAVGQQKEEVFLCCVACTKSKLDAKHWATIHANIAKAQGKCPVMQKSLPKNPKWTIVNGQIVYVCCPPCTSKIEKDPEAFLKRVDSYYTASIQPGPAVR